MDYIILITLIAYHSKVFAVCLIFPAKMTTALWEGGRTGGDGYYLLLQWVDTLEFSSMVVK